MNEWPRAPYGVEEGRSCSGDPFARVLNSLFGCDQESSRPAGRCRRPGAELLRQARGSRARIVRGYDIRHDCYAIESMPRGGRTTVQRAKQIRRFDTACLRSLRVSAMRGGGQTKETGELPIATALMPVPSSTVSMADVVGALLDCLASVLGRRT